MTSLDNAFWGKKSLEDMSIKEWESLCDHCGRCCLTKIEDIDTGELFYTNVICRYYDQDKSGCTQYLKRSQLVPTCIKVTPKVALEEKWLPDTCAYRLLAEKKPLYDWHPLVSGDPTSVIHAGIAVSGKVTSEEYVHEDELPEHLVNWFDRSDRP